MSHINDLIRDLSIAHEKTLRIRHDLERVRNSIGDLSDRIELIQREDDREQLIATRRRARDKERHLLSELLEAELYENECRDAYLRRCNEVKRGKACSA